MTTLITTLVNIPSAEVASKSFVASTYMPLGGVPSWTSANASSTVEYDVAGTTVTGGIVIKSGYANATKSAGNTAGGNLLSKLPFVLDMAGANPTNLSIVVTSLSGTATIYSSLNWKEIR